MHYVETQLRRSVSHLRTSAGLPDGPIRSDRCLQPDESRPRDESVGRSEGFFVRRYRPDFDSDGRPENCVIGCCIRSRDLEPLTARQDLVEALIRESFLLNELRTSFSEIRDVERTISRLSQGSGKMLETSRLSRCHCRKVPRCSGASLSSSKVEHWPMSSL